MTYYAIFFGIGLLAGVFLAYPLAAINANKKGE